MTWKVSLLVRDTQKRESFGDKMPKDGVICKIVRFVGKIVTFDVCMTELRAAELDQHHLMNKILKRLKYGVINYKWEIVKTVSLGDSGHVESV